MLNRIDFAGEGAMRESNLHAFGSGCAMKAVAPGGPLPETNQMLSTAIFFYR
jgi:hypothetical protein